MKVLVDSNIIFSMLYAPGSHPHQAFSKASKSPYRALICEYSLEELRRVINRKFPNRISHLERFLAKALPLVEIVPVPLSVHPDEDLIRDINDRPILRAAIYAQADILLTGDKDFIESKVKKPKIMTAAQFLLGEPAD